MLCLVLPARPERSVGSHEGRTYTSLRDVCGLRRYNKTVPIYHLTAQTLSRSDGRSSTAAAAYRAAESISDERAGLVHDYSRKRGVDHSEIMAPANAPGWAHDRAKLWNAVEHSEKRKDSQVAREVEFALPTELYPNEQVELVRGFVRSQFVSAGMVADVNLHHLESSNPHAHVLLSMRDIGPDGFGAKNRSWNDKALLLQWREAWAEHVNTALERAGHTVRIDHRTLAAQGIDRVPQIHLGAKVIEMESRGIRTERGSRALEIEAANAAIAALKSDLEAIENERNHETAAGPQPGADRGGVRAAGRVAGDTGRPGGQQHGGSERSEPAASARMEREPNAGGGSGGGVGQGGGATGEVPAVDNQRVASNSGGHVEGDPEAVLDAGGHGGGGGHPRSGALDRVVALAGSSAPSPTGREGGGRTLENGDRKRRKAPMKPDRSYLAARRQLDAMCVDRFEVGIRDQAGRMLIRTWSKAETLQAMAWLKRENAKGADVYVRPAGDTNAGLVLVDDLTRGQLARMRAAGMTPATVTETSPDNFQAWVRVSASPLVPAVATAVANMLAEQFGGDPNSADWRHFGRLAGLTNSKPKHKDANGRSPYVLSHECSGKVAPAGLALVEQAAQRVRDREASIERQSRIEAAQTAPERTNGRDPVSAYRRGLRALYARFGANMDVSRADYMIAADMAVAGFSAEQIGAAIEVASPELPTRKAGHEADYVARTVKAVMRSPKVAEAVAMREQTDAPRPGHRPA